MPTAQSTYEIEMLCACVHVLAATERDGEKMQRNKFVRQWNPFKSYLIRKIAANNLYRDKNLNTLEFDVYRGTNSYQCPILYVIACRLAKIATDVVLQQISPS